MQKKPIGFRQLCALARAVLTEDLSIDDAEWRERIKCRIVSLGYTYPQPMHAIGEVMSRVERAVHRPLPVPPVPLTLADVAPPPAPPAWRLPRAAGDSSGWDALGTREARRSLTTMLQQWHPEALQVLRRAATAPGTAEALTAATVRQRAARAAAAQRPTSPAVRRLQAAVLAHAAAVQARLATPAQVPDDAHHADPGAASGDLPGPGPADSER